MKSHLSQGAQSSPLKSRDGHPNSPKEPVESLPKETALGTRTPKSFSWHKEGQVTSCSLVGGRNPNSQSQRELGAEGSGGEGRKACGAQVVNRLACCLNSLLKAMGTEQEQSKHNACALYGAPSDSSL